MDEAVASEGDEVGLRVAPAGERVRPLPRATEIENRLAQGDHLAVGDPGEDRLHLARGDRDHDLVQQRHSLGDSSLQDQRVSAPEPREHRRIGIRRALGDLPRFDEARVSASVPLEQARQRREHQPPGVLNALAAGLLHEPLTARDPAHRRSQVTPEEEA
jgi:hypothetical protein